MLSWRYLVAGQRRAVAACCDRRPGVVACGDLRSCGFGALVKEPCRSLDIFGFALEDVEVAHHTHSLPAVAVDELGRALFIDALHLSVELGRLDELHEHGLSAEELAYIPKDGVLIDRAIERRVIAPRARDADNGLAGDPDRHGK